jgi:excisionase family DNA binding protein
MPGDSPLPQQLRFAIGEAAQILRISRVTLYRRINAGLIQIQKDGRRSFVTAAELQRYANSSH